MVGCYSGAYIQVMFYTIGLKALIIMRKVLLYLCLPFIQYTNQFLINQRQRFFIIAPVGIKITGNRVNVVKIIFNISGYLSLNIQLLEYRVNMHIQIMLDILFGIRLNPIR